MSSTRCAPFWLDQPSILYEEAADFFPFHTMAQKCTSTALNSLTRFGLYLGIILSLLTFKLGYLGISLGIAIVSIATYKGMKSQDKLREGFEEKIVVGPTLFSATSKTGDESTKSMIGGAELADKMVDDVIGRNTRTLPTGPNPFMNLLINEIKDNPKKPPAINIDTPEMGRELSDQFQSRVYNDPNDVFQHTQNQRIWVVQPSTSIPNDRESYQNWLYRVPGKTCKEGNNAVCRTATEGTAVTWLSSL